MNHFGDKQNESMVDGYILLVRDAYYVNTEIDKVFMSNAEYIK